MNLISQTSFLLFLAHLKPETYDALIPHGPKISEGTRHVMASMIIKSVAKEVTDSNIAKELHWAGKSLFDAGAKSMSYDDNFWFWFWPYPPRPNWSKDLIHFGPHPEPWHFTFGEEVMLNPQPLPPIGEEVMLNPQPLPPKWQAHYGAVLTLLADAVSFENMSEVLRNIGYSLMEQPVE